MDLPLARCQVIENGNAGAGNVRKNIYDHFICQTIERKTTQQLDSFLVGYFREKHIGLVRLVLSLGYEVKHRIAGVDFKKRTFVPMRKTIGICPDPLHKPIVSFGQEAVDGHCRYDLDFCHIIVKKTAIKPPDGFIAEYD